jgi:subtilisin family serine protease
MGAKQPPVQVGVFDHEGNCLNNVQVRLEPEKTNGKAADLHWDSSRRCYFARGVDPGPYRLVAERVGHCDEQRVQVGSTGLRSIVLFNSGGLPFLYRGQVKTPFQPEPDLFAIALDDTVQDDAVATISAIAKKERLNSEFLDWNREPPHHARVFRFPADAPAASKPEIVQEFVRIGGVHALGPLVHFKSNDSISCLTDELVIRFRPGVTRAQIDDLAERRNLTMLRKLIVAENVFVFRMPAPVSYDTLALANEMARCDLVLYAEPNLISIGIQDAIGSSAAAGVLEPTDFLFPVQWHLPRIRCPQAWRLMHDRLSPDRAMGDPDITLAVVDWGIDVDHPEFAGKLSNGEPKVSSVFDFHNMVPNNRGRAHGHGTCCAGVATALPNNTGVCGVAGNCRLMAIRRPEGIMASETAYSDMYLWIAGFDPRSPTPCFPKRIHRGADAISNSFGYAAGLPISGLMKDTFDFLTERGRNGRGVLLFFSAGNSGGDLTLERPWAAYERTLAVTASTLGNGGIGEIRAKESSLGDAYATLDFCAPSASSLTGLYDPPASYAIITAADRCSTDPDHNLQPNAPAEGRVRTTILEDAAAQEQAPAVISSEGFAAGQFVLIGKASSAEFNQIAGIPDGTHLRLKDGLSKPRRRGTAVVGGPADALHSFSGTSCATAIAAGLGALLLSACRALTWDQVRSILRGTAVRIDDPNSDPIGGWRQIDGVPYSSWYGFGRIDAFLAVDAALARRSFWARAAACLTAALRFRHCGGGDTHRG